MRIAFISYEYLPVRGIGGIATYLKIISQLLSNQKINVHIICSSDVDIEEIKVNDCLTEHHINADTPEIFNNLLLKRFKTLHNKYRFDAYEAPEIHHHSLLLKEAFPSLYSIVRLHAPTQVIKISNQSYYRFAHKLRFVLGSIRRLKIDLGYWRNYEFKLDPEYQATVSADLILSPSSVMSNWASKNWKIPLQDITLLGNPFEYSDKFQHARTNNAEKTILFYGRLSILKGLITATLAMKEILRNYPDWKWIIVGADGNSSNGKGSMRSWIESNINAGDNTLEFHPTLSQAQIIELMGHCSIVIIPSLFESFSYVAIEALTAGKVVVCSDQVGVQDLFEQGHNGFIIPPKNVRKWIDVLSILVKDADLRERIGKNAIASIKESAFNSPIVNFYSNLQTQRN